MGCQEVVVGEMAEMRDWRISRQAEARLRSPASFSRLLNFNISPVPPLTVSQNLIEPAEQHKNSIKPILQRRETEAPK